MRTKLFEWADRQGFDLKDLAEMTGYSERHLRRIRDEGFPVTEDFQAAVVFKMGDWARSLFFAAMSPAGDAGAPERDSGPAAEPPSAAPGRVSAPRCEDESASERVA